jgi:hypothetical protein
MAGNDSSLGRLGRVTRVDCRIAGEPRQVGTGTFGHPIQGRGNALQIRLQGAA